MTPTDALALIDRLVACDNTRFAPYWGWHDDHRATDGTPAYLPALQQVRAEYAALLELVMTTRKPALGSCLQLGLGATDASHLAWRCAYDHVTTIDLAACLVDGLALPGLDTHDPLAIALTARYAPYDLIFVDAGHAYGDVAADHAAYAPLLRPGGVLAFHDALPRAAYPELGVWRYLETLSPAPTIIGDEVGIAWLRP